MSFSVARIVPKNVSKSKAPCNSFMVRDCWLLS